MKTKIAVLFLLIGLTLLAPLQLLQAQETESPKQYEYATARFMGYNTSIVWEDGTVEKIVKTSGFKYPSNADFRMYMLTVAMNMMAKKGYQLIVLDGSDVIMRREAAK